MSVQNGYTNGRDPRGYFSKGNKIASGNPMNVRMRELRQSLLNCATEVDIRDLYSSLMESARGGDTAATKLLFEYLVGKPVQSVELSAPGGDPTRVMRVIMPILMKILNKYPDAKVELAAALEQVGLPSGCSPSPPQITNP